MSELTFREGVTRALAEELERDDRVLLLGEDVGAAGGVFQATAGLFDRFGPRRVRDTPISEQAIVGCALGASVSQDASTGLLLINEEFTTSLIVSRCQTTPGGGHRWHLRLEPGLAPDLTIAARFLPDNTTILDYYLFPGIDALAAQIRLAPDNPITLDVYRFPDLEFFRSVARRARIQEVA